MSIYGKVASHMFDLIKEEDLKLTEWYNQQSLIQPMITVKEVRQIANSILSQNQVREAELMEALETIYQVSLEPEPVVKAIEEANTNQRLVERIQDEIGRIERSHCSGKEVAASS